MAIQFICSVRSWSVISRGREVSRLPVLQQPLLDWAFSPRQTAKRSRIFVACTGVCPDMKEKQLPLRITWATSIVAGRSPARVLEVGFGNGLSIHCLSTLLPNARIYGIDRSPSACERARRRNSDAISDGRVVLDCAELPSAAVAGRFDAMVAVNVNLFWTSDAMPELEWVRRRLTGDGVLFLFYEPPSRGQVDRIEARLSENLDRAGFTRREVMHMDHSDAGMLGLVASEPGTTGLPGSDQ